MSLKKRLIPALVGATLALGATASQAITFNGVYIFGGETHVEFSYSSLPQSQ